MTTKPEWHDFGVATAYRDEKQPLLWHYLPKAPHLRRGPDGKVQHSLIDAGGMIMLGLTAEFGLDDAAQEALRIAIIKVISPKGDQDKLLDPASIQLQAEPVAIARARLMLTNDSGAKDLASVTPSGFGMQSAAFMISVSGQDADALKAALAGEKGRLVVQYEGSRAEERSAEVSLKGRIEDVIGDGALPGDKTEADHLIEQALTAGTIKLETFADSEASPALKKDAMIKARLLAAEGLARFTKDPSPAASGALDTAARQTETVSVPFSSSVDVTF